MNIYDVSHKAGVSIATVSRVLNGNPNVSPKTRQKVLDVMQELGYTPNVFARGLGLNTMKTIGILCLDSSDPFLANAVYYLEQNLRKYGYDIILCCTGYDLKNKQKYLDLLLSKRVDAVILVGSSFLEPQRKDNTYLFQAAASVPVIIINGYINHPNIYCALCDDAQAVFDATTKLIENGRTNILYLYHSKSYSGQQKLSGYKEAILSAGLKLDENLMLLCKNDMHQTKEAITEAAANGVKFDAVIAAEDLLAVGAIKYAKQAGLKIPKDLAVIGYNNSLLSSCCEPELTTIDNHIETISITAVNTLMRVFSGNDVPNRTTISNDLVERGTTDFAKNEI